MPSRPPGSLALLRGPRSYRRLDCLAAPRAHPPRPMSARPPSHSPRNPLPCPTPHPGTARPGTCSRPAAPSAPTCWRSLHRTQPATPLPLLLVFHGAGGRAAGIAVHTGLTAAGHASRGYAVVYPAGISRRWNDGRSVNAGPDDVAFVRLLIDSLTRALPVDPKRIYATGISNGAGLAYRLACDLPGTFAAIAPVAGRAGGRAGAAVRGHAAGLARRVPGHRRPAHPL